MTAATLPEMAKSDRERAIREFESRFNTTILAEDQAIYAILFENGEFTFHGGFWSIGTLIKTNDMVSVGCL